MNRKDMLYYIKEDLKDFVANYEKAKNPQSREAKLQASAEGMLTMVEGFGMLPPKRKTSVKDVPREIQNDYTTQMDLEAWMVLNLPKEMNKWEDS